MRKLLMIFPLMLSAIFLSAYRSPDEMAGELRQLSARADSGDAEANYRMALLYERGFDSIPRDSLRSLQLLRRSAEAGWLPAENYLGFLLLQAGETREGLHWIEQAAIAGDPKAQGNLGFLLLDEGSNTELRAGIVADEAKAAYWLERAALSGVATAASMLGDLYRDGRGVAQDSLQAAAHYRAAIDAGLADAAYKLEAMERQRWLGLPPREQMAIALYLYTHLAPDIAVDMFGRLADLPDPQLLPDDADPLDTHDGDDAEVKAHALALLGDAYTRALGVGYDYDKSLEYYWRAAELGNAPAQFVIAELLEIFPDALAALTLSPPTPGELRQSAAEAGIMTAAEATRHLLSQTPEK